MKKQCKNPECPLPNREFETNRSKKKYCSRSCNNKDKYRVRMEGAKEYQVISCGGGVQSAGMIALVVSGKLPKPDMVVMVDTGYEKQSTMEYVKRILIPACNGINLEFQIIKNPDNSIFNKQGMILIPAFKQLENGKSQRLYTFCNGGWKLAVIKKYLRERGVKRGQSWIGISMDEFKRQRQSHQNWLLNRYPLIELNMSRYQCLFFVRSLGWPDPPRTSCIMCPLQHDNEWELMKQNYPEDYQRCVEIDTEIEKRNKNIFLHKSMVRLKDIVWRYDIQRGGPVKSLDVVGE